MATIGDVARHAGVSRSTVSYALTGKRSISSETRERIQEAIRELGFTPNAGARALATSQTMVIGLFVHFYEDEFLAGHASVRAPDCGRRARGRLRHPDGHRDRWSGSASRISSTGMVDGVILLNVSDRDDRIPILRNAKQPGSTVGLPRNAEGVDVFDLDFEESARVLVDHLHERGHRDLILITPQQHVFERGGAYAWRFRDAALERASRYGIRVTSFAGETQQPNVNRQLNEILDARPEATALVVHNDASIAALPTVLHDRGVKVPDDLSVVSLFSESFGRLFSLPYTAVESSPDELGRSAVQALVRRMIDPVSAGEYAVSFVAPRITDRGSAQ